MADVTEQALTELEMENLTVAHQKFASSLLSWARANKIAAKDWVQGGWSRGKDKFDIGVRQQGAPQD